MSGFLFLWPYGQWGCGRCGYFNEGRGEQECARCGKRRGLPWYVWSVRGRSRRPGSLPRPDHSRH